MTLLVYLSDCTGLRSATRVVPGSHLWPCIGKPNNGGTGMEEVEPYASLIDQAVAVPADAGDAVLMHGQLYHAGAGASSAGPRIVVTLAFRSVDELAEEIPARCRLVRGSRIHRGRGRSVCDVRELDPVAEGDFARVLDFVETHRALWERSIEAGLLELTRHLGTVGYKARESEGSNSAGGQSTLGAGEVILSGRLKDSQAIVSKMRRFGEPLRAMLDIWGFRAIVATERDLDHVAACCAELWETPASGELLLRHGKLQFDWWRDYWRRDHAGLSPATTAHYDQAIHINRKAPWGIVEIQVMTFDLYRRVHCDPSSEDSHDRFVALRETLFRGGEL